ncbi:diphthine--ammonia ligase [Natrinema sp. H-ect4]|uniref:Dph6-related ATP pyrophosphatase n=1 Tax=Natrinema sp. H-ect4 TaxID=3242699 RepID=UPI0035A8D041
MFKPDDGWIVLFSGGKESSLALYQALENGRDVRRLVFVHSPTAASAYHAPAAPVVRLAAQSIGIPLVNAGLPAVDVEPPDIDADFAPDTEVAEGTEIDSFENTIHALDAELNGGVTGIIVGTVESEHRTDHVRSICNRVGCDFCAPLLGVDPRELAETMIESGLEIVVVEVTAPGFDESWLGRRLDRDALAELEALRRDQGVHLLGEGGEFETVVTDGPHMSRPIAFESHREWHGSWGRLRITDAWLEAPDEADRH